ncbi:MAG: ATP-binding protein [Bacteroidales bacterium]|nr:ATP-binding protein [Candidatus Cacconaster equi]
MKMRFDPVEGRNAEIIESVMSCEEILSLPDDLQFKVRLCTEEVEENILCYSGSTWVEVGVDKGESYLTLEFRDGGVEFDPLAKEDPDINTSIEERKVGGLGIFLCKQMMDYLEYRFEDGCNLFIMKKKI